MALPSRVSLLLALGSRQGAAEKLTAESAADLVQASYDVAAARSTEGAAQAGVDQAPDAFPPRARVSATYTRLSDFTLAVPIIDDFLRLLLLHTLRTQADYLGRLVAYLVDHWTVTIVDLPGHGFSDAPHLEYDHAFFTDTIRALVQLRDMRGVTIVGESIGASIPLPSRPTAIAAFVP
jgi:hypothetical protein